MIEQRTNKALSTPANQPLPGEPRSLEVQPLAPRRPTGWSLRFQLLATVQVALVVMLSVALYVDHHRELKFVLSERQAVLEEEAYAVALAITALIESDPTLVQTMLNRFIANPSQPPSHHIFVKIGNHVLMPDWQGPFPDNDFLKQIANIPPPDEAKNWDRRDMVIAARSIDGIIAYVVEPISAIRRQVLRESVLRILGLLAAGIIASILIEFILWRAFIRPVEKLANTVECIADGELGAQVESFHTRELEILGSAINQMSQRLEAYDRGRRRELDKARRLQQYLQSAWPEVRGLAIDRFYVPATDVTGDYQDLLQHSEGDCTICLADVTGHGVPAAMTAAMLKILFQHAALERIAPNRLLEQLNEEFGEVVLLGDFATMFVMTWSVVDSTIQYASAGHLPGILLRKTGELELLESTGVVLGAMPDGKWDMNTVPVSAGDRLLLVTDGVTEMFGPHRELFGLDRLTEAFRETQAKPQAEILPSIRTVLERHRVATPVADDITMISIQFDC